MSVMSVNWATKTELPYGWYRAAGPGEPTFSSGLQFHGSPSLVMHDKNLLSSLSTLGTSVVRFSIGTTTQSSVNHIAMVPYALSYPSEGVYCPSMTAVCKSTALMLTVQCKVNSDPGDMTFEGVALSVSGLTAPSTGTLSSSWHYSSGDDGTVVSVLTYNGTTQGTLQTTVGTDLYVQLTSERPYVGHMGRKIVGDGFLKLTGCDYQVTLAAVAPSTTPTLSYSGYYSNGSQLGNYDLSSHVLDVSPVQNSFYFPGVKAGIFSPEVTVTLKNDTNQWGTFTGYASTGTVYQPPGLFYVRHPKVMAGEPSIFTGFADYSTLKINDTDRTVTVKLESVIGRMLKKSIMPARTLGGSLFVRGEHDEQSLYAPITAGTVTTATGYYGEEGTVVLGRYAGYAIPEIQARDLVAVYPGDETVLVQEVIDWDTEECTFTVKKRPSWLRAGETVNVNKPRIESLKTALEFYEKCIQKPLEKIAGDYGGAPAPIWALGDSYATALTDVLISPSHKFSGAETLQEIINEMLAATGGGMGFDGQGIAVFTPSLNQLTATTQGTFVFSEIAYGQKFIQSTEEAVARVWYNYGWDDDDEKFTVQLEAVAAAGVNGKDITLNSKLVRLTEQAAEATASLIVFWGGGGVLSFMVDPSYWVNFKPGSIADFSDLPASFHVTTAKMLVLQRTIDPETEWLTVTVTELVNAAVEYFRVGVDSIGGDMPVI